MDKWMGGTTTKILSIHCPMDPIIVLTEIEESSSLGLKKDMPVFSGPLFYFGWTSTVVKGCHSYLVLIR